MEPLVIDFGPLNKRLKELGLCPFPMENYWCDPHTSGEGEDTIRHLGALAEEWMVQRLRERENEDEKGAGEV